MKKLFVVMVVALSLLITGISFAEEFSSTGRANFVADYTVMPFSKDTMRLNYDSYGISTNDAGKGLFHNGVTHAKGGADIVKGVSTESGFATITLTNGDKVFMVYKASGTAEGIKGVHTYVGGTGIAKGITGGGTFTRYLLSRTKDKSFTWTTTKTKYTLPDKK